MAAARTERAPVRALNPDASVCETAAGGCATFGAGV
jgi:hypothetical protein